MRSAQLEQLLERAGDRQPASAEPVAPAPSAPDPPAPRAVARDGGLRLPAPRLSALLVLVFLGFGVVLGDAARSPVNDTLASTRGPVRVVLGPTAATPAKPTEAEAEAGAPGAGETAGEESPPPVEAQATPPAAAPAAPAPSKPAPSKPTPGSGGAPPATAPSGAPATKLPAIKHVFVVMLSDQPYASVFGPSSSAPYIAHKLEHEGELLPHYDAVAHEQLANELALLSGQGPTAETAVNCPSYTEIAPATFAADEQVLGAGCVYPQATQTLAGQLTAKHLQWKAYVQGTDEAGAPPACAHPTLGQADPTAAAGTGAYATYVDPFVYFASIVGSPRCASNVVGIGQLQGDLANPTSTPSFAYIAPSRCHDANPTPCMPGSPAGPVAADSFLEQVVPEITASKAYKEGGLLVITTDEAPSTGEFADSSSCCGQPTFPNLAATAPAGLAPRGGGTVGALLLSPYVKGATTNQEKFNHFSLLRTIEDLFGVAHLGYAGLSTVAPFEASMFTASKN